jgi:5-formyltetrahydrofolate cyclo-ligase
MNADPAPDPKAPDPEAPDPKAKARAAAFAARALAHADAAGRTPRAIAHLLRIIGPGAGRIVAGYMAMRTEIDPTAAMEALHAQGARICVPVIEGRGLPLRFREWAPGCALVDGPFGARIPETGDWLVPDTLIVPLVAFDARLNRLGYGGGFYDRTLEGLRAAAPTRAIGFAYAAQELPALPLEPTDQPLDALVTENGPLAAARSAP